MHKHSSMALWTLAVHVCQSRVSIVTRSPQRLALSLAHVPGGWSVAGRFWFVRLTQPHKSTATESVAGVGVFSRSEWIKRWMLFSSAQVRAAELFVRNFQRDRWAVRCHPCCLRLWSVLTAQLSFVAKWMRVCEENTNERSSASSAAVEGHSRAHRSSTAHRGFSALHYPNLRIFFYPWSGRLWALGLFSSPWIGR